MANLSRHFGEDASLEPATAKVITDYLVAHAGDAGGRSSWTMAGLAPAKTPIAITDMPFWRGIHSRFSPAFFARHGAKSKGDCTACHGPGGPG